ncbi:hypothetical protein ACFO9Q_22595 [Paenibacillus sp. GCM10023252]|uniref:hypothetical protein n=1 Tax=Paenibacillus sp. GCM10023252 TaxID=3252649 RepID=UPI00361B9B77
MNNGIEAPASKLLIKLVIGRTLIDTEARGLSFQVNPNPSGGWSIRVEGLTDADVRLLQEQLSYLNIFLFETDSTQSAGIRKYWLYDKEEPKLSYEEHSGTTIIEVDSKVAYSNEGV